jgi:hypothetical protein
MSYKLRQSLCILLPKELHNSEEGARAFTNTVFLHLLHLRPQHDALLSHPATTIIDAHYSYDKLFQLNNRATLNSMLHYSSKLGDTPRLQFSITPEPWLFQEYEGLMQAYEHKPDYMSNVEAALSAMDKLDPQEWDGFLVYTNLPVTRAVSLLAMDAMESGQIDKHRTFRTNIGVMPSEFVSQEFVTQLASVKDYRAQNGCMPSTTLDAFQQDIATFVELVATTAKSVGLEAVITAISDDRRLLTRAIRPSDLPSPAIQPLTPTQPAQVISLRPSAERNHEVSMEP